MEYLKSISKEEFKDNISIFFSNIITGFDLYKNCILSPSSSNLKEAENSYINFIKKCFELNNKCVYVDFYINSIDSNSVDIIYRGLDEEDRYIFNKIKGIKPRSYFFMVLDEKVLKLFVKMCTRELFFITFYFSKHPITIWGNYNLKFPIFYKEDVEFQKYKEILKEFNINFIFN